jgi:hypothetical protein
MSVSLLGLLVDVRLAAASVAAALLAASAVAEGREPHAGIARGTEGLAAVRLEVGNLTGGEIVCTAQLAHWHSAELGRAGPGDAVTAELWHDPRDGILALLNAAGDRMPIEALWCAVADASPARRASVPLPFRAGPSPEGLAVLCRTDRGGRFICERI